MKAVGDKLLINFREHGYEQTREATIIAIVPPNELVKNVKPEIVSLYHGNKHVHFQTYQSKRYQRYLLKIEFPENKHNKSPHYYCMRTDTAEKKDEELRGPFEA